MNVPQRIAAVSCALAAISCGTAREAEAKRETHVLPALTELQLSDVDGAQVPLTDVGGDAALLVVRVGTSWCGPCRWQAEHTRSLLSDASAARVAVVEVLIAGRDNGAPDALDFSDWQARADGPVQVLGDPDYLLSAWFAPGAALPGVLLVDSRTLQPLAAVSAPTAPAFSAAVAAALAQLDGVSAPAASEPSLHDGLFTQDAWELIAAMQLPSHAQPDPSNAYAELPAAVAWGEQLFFSGKLGPSGRDVSCSSCHIPELLFQDGKDQPPEGVGIGSRNVPTIVLAPEARWQFWDGRADSSWAQASVPLEDPQEIASSRLFVAHAVKTHFERDYQAIFGDLPALADQGRFPDEGGPGDASWQSMTAQDQQAVNRVFANVGKALAAYERSLRPLPNALDRYAAGDTSSLTDEQKAGLQAFFSAGCVQCHYGPRLSDDAFHALRFPTGRPDRSADPGRREVLEALEHNEFLRSGDFSDQPLAAVAPTDAPRLLGAFKTPSLRGVPYTLPYGHGGSFGGLPSVVEAHRVPAVPEDSKLALGAREPWLDEFDASLVGPLVAFLKTLAAELPPGTEAL